MYVYLSVNWDTLVPWAYQLCCLPNIDNTIEYSEGKRGNKMAERIVQLQSEKRETEEQNNPGWQDGVLHM